MRSMTNLRVGFFVVAAAQAAVGVRGAVADEASVKVGLWDKDGKMGITLSQDKVEAGTVKFEIKNQSNGTMHEFLITPWRGSDQLLPSDTTQVHEEKLPHLQGVEDMKPGAEAILRIVLSPGDYVIFCNQSGHYKMDMVRRFTVEQPRHS